MRWPRASRVDPLHYDATLSDVGKVKMAREILRDVAIDLVITTPLTRALQTTAGLFSDHPCSPPILVESLHRERVETVNVGRSPAFAREGFRRLRSTIYRRYGGTRMTARTSEACASSLSKWFSREPTSSGASCCSGRNTGSQSSVTALSSAT